MNDPEEKTKDESHDEGPIGSNAAAETRVEQDALDEQELHQLSEDKLDEQELDQLSEDTLDQIAGGQSLSSARRLASLARRASPASVARRAVRKGLGEALKPEDRLEQ